MDERRKITSRESRPSVSRPLSGHFSLFSLSGGLHAVTENYLQYANVFDHLGFSSGVPNRLTLDQLWLGRVGFPTHRLGHAVCLDCTVRHSAGRSARAIS